MSAGFITCREKLPASPEIAWVSFIGLIPNARPAVTAICGVFSSYCSVGVTFSKRWGTIGNPVKRFVFVANSNGTFNAGGSALPRKDWADNSPSLVNETGDNWLIHSSPNLKRLVGSCFRTYSKAYINGLKKIVPISPLGIWTTFGTRFPWLSWPSPTITIK